MAVWTSIALQRGPNLARFVAGGFAGHTSPGPRETAAHGVCSTAATGRNIVRQTHAGAPLERAIAASVQRASCLAVRRRGNSLRCASWAHDLLALAAARWLIG